MRDIRHLSTSKSNTGLRPAIEHDLLDEASPKLSIICVTYNHERYIADCLDGFLRQETNFRFEIIIHDDASTDTTADIVRAYSAKHPDLFRPILQIENQMQKGVGVMPLLLRSARGVYIAFCEGDDYWTDPCKLQKQVELLEGSPECSLCFHNVLIIDDDHSESRRGYLKPMKSMYRLEDLALGNFIYTPSVVFRAESICGSLPAWVLRMPMGDWPIWILCAQKGKLAYLDDVSAVYRVHSSGYWSAQSELSRTENSIRAASILKLELLPELSEIRRAETRFRRDAVDLAMEVANFQRASYHAKRLLYPNAYLSIRDWLFYLQIVLRGDFPALWNCLYRFKSVLRCRAGLFNRRA